VILPNATVPPAGALSVTVLLPFRVSWPLKVDVPLLIVSKVVGPAVALTMIGMPSL
jgi:hypothetical protein